MLNVDGYEHLEWVGEHWGQDHIQAWAEQILPMFYEQKKHIYIKKQK
jgi:hypothetical protein